MTDARQGRFIENEDRLQAARLALGAAAIDSPLVVSLSFSVPPRVGTQQCERFTGGGVLRISASV